MAANQPNSPVGAVVLDANVTIALASREAVRAAVVTAELTIYSTQGYSLYAPAAIITETVYILCGKVVTGALSTADYATAIATFERTMQNVLPPPTGDVGLIHRAEQIRAEYGCSRSADPFTLPSPKSYRRA